MTRSKLTRLLLLALGVVMLVVVIRSAGTDDVKAVLSRALRWLPLLLVLEGARIPIEFLTTRTLLGKAKARVSVVALAKIQLIFYAFSIIAPGGRLVAEASKATLLRTHTSGPRAAAVATAGQATSFIADAAVGVLGALSAYALSGWSIFTMLMAGFVLACSCLAFLVITGARGRLLTRLTARFPRLTRFLARFRGAARAQRMLVFRAVALLFSARLCQVAFFGAALSAVGIGTSLAGAFAGLSLSLLGSAAGDAIPAQLGATDAAFVLAAPLIGAGVAALASVAVLFHISQLFWVAMGTLAAAFWPQKGPARAVQPSRSKEADAV